jgi:hypothetical protein
MDWIEQWFGIAPDNGDGTLELLIWLVVAAVIVSAAAWRVPRARAAALRFFCAAACHRHRPARGLDGSLLDETISGRF